MSHGEWAERERTVGQRQDGVEVEWKALAVSGWMIKTVFSLHRLSCRLGLSRCVVRPLFFTVCQSALISVFLFRIVCLCVCI